jgi:hypothetical protein
MAELIVNGDFSSDTIGEAPASWIAGSGAVLTAEANGHSGNCMKIATNGWSQMATQEIVTTQGVTYEVSFWHKHGSGEYGFGIVSEQNWQLLKGFSSSSMSSDTEWTQRTGTFVADGSVALVRAVTDTPNPGSYALFDDISVTEVPSTPTSATLAGPTEGTVAVSSSAFTITLNASADQTYTASLSSNGSGDVFKNSSGTIITTLQITAGNTAGTFYLVPGSTGARSVSFTISPLLTYVGTPHTYTSNTFTNLIQNGTFEDGTNHWTAHGATEIESVAGGSPGNCLKVTAKLTSQLYSSADQSFTTVAGSVYTVSLDVKNGNHWPWVSIYDYSGNSVVTYKTYSSVDWSTKTFTFTAPATNTGILLYSADWQGADGDYAYFDNVSIEVAPSITVGDVSLSSKTAYTVNLTCTAASGGTGTLTYQWSRSPDNSTFTAIGGATDGTSLADENLTSSTDYWYRLRVTDSLGGYADTTPIKVTTDAATFTAGSVYLASKTDTIINLTCSAALNGVGTVSYQWKRSPHGTNTWSNIGTNAQLVQDTGRTANTTYDYKVTYTDTTLASVDSAVLAVTTDCVVIVDCGDR